jgi:hypothetical protein
MACDATAQEMDAISGLDRSARIGPNPDALGQASYGSG